VSVLDGADQGYKQQVFINKYDEIEWA